MRKAVNIILALCIFISCTNIAYEKRIDCPYKLHLNLSKCSKDIKELQIWFFNDQNHFLIKDTIPKSKLGHIYEFNANGKSVKYYIWANISKNTKIREIFTQETLLEKIEYKNNDSLYYYSNEIETQELADIYDTVFLSRQYANVNLDIIGYFINKEINIETITESSAYYLNANIYHKESSMHYKPLMQTAEYCNFKYTIYRQNNIKSLRIQVNVSNNSKNELHSKEIAIGEILHKNGYDMLKKDLDDIYLSLDLRSGNINIKSGNWSHTEKIDIIFS